MWPNGDMNNGALVPLAGPVFLLRLAKNQDAPITAAGHRKDYERERDRADTLMAELLKSTPGGGNGGEARRRNCGPTRPALVEATRWLNSLAWDGGCSCAAR